jgi:outer membrane biosynthesis protein TonB
MERMQKKSKHINSGFSEFLRYRKGKITGKKRNAFERNLQRDAFADEANEGFDMISADELSDDMKKMSTRLERRIHKSLRNTLYRVAASIAVLMIVSSVFFIIEKNKKTSALQQSEEGTIMEIRKDEPLFGEPSSEKQAPVIKEKRKTKSPEQSRPKVDQPDENVTPPTRSPGNVEREFSPAEESKPVKTQNENLITGTKRSLRSVPAVYEKSAESDSIDLAYSPAHPVPGFEEYEKYIRKNIQRPDSSDQRAVVVTSFTVLSNGTISGIRIIRSSGQEFSDEAIRLLRNGPAWKPANRNGAVVEDSVTYRIIF